MGDGRLISHNPHLIIAGAVALPIAQGTMHIRLQIGIHWHQGNSG